MAFIYHYAKERFAVLKCKALQEAEKENTQGSLVREILNPHKLPYDRSISFLMEPAPLDIIGGIFGKEHHTWAPDTVLYEHKVDTGSLGPVIYKLVESVENTEYYYDPKNDSLSDSAFMKGYDAIIEKHGYLGTDLHKLDSLVKGNKGNTRKYYELLPTRSNFEDLRLKYAGSVPHLMLYPKLGLIRPISIRRVLVGRSGPGFRPKFANW